jgi:hypothetical protein
MSNQVLKNMLDGSTLYFTSAATVRDLLEVLLKKIMVLFSSRLISLRLILIYTSKLHLSLSFRFLIKTGIGLHVFLKSQVFTEIG